MKDYYVKIATGEVSDDLAVGRKWYQDGFRVIVARVDESGKPFHRWEMIG